MVALLLDSMKSLKRVDTQATKDSKLASDSMAGEDGLFGLLAQALVDRRIALKEDAEDPDGWDG